MHRVFFRWTLNVLVAAIIALIPSMPPASAESLSASDPLASSAPEVSADSVFSITSSSEPTEFSSPLDASTTSSSDIETLRQDILSDVQASLNSAYPQAAELEQELALVNEELAQDELILPKTVEGSTAILQRLTTFLEKVRGRVTDPTLAAEIEDYLTLGAQQLDPNNPEGIAQKFSGLLDLYLQTRRDRVTFRLDYWNDWVQTLLDYQALVEAETTLEGLQTLEANYPVRGPVPPIPTAVPDFRDLGLWTLIQKIPDGSAQGYHYEEVGHGLINDGIDLMTRVMMSSSPEEIADSFRTLAENPAEIPPAKFGLYYGKLFLAPTSSNNIEANLQIMNDLRAYGVEYLEKVTAPPAVDDQGNYVLTSTQIQNVKNFYSELSAHGLDFYISPLVMTKIDDPNDPLSGSYDVTRWEQQILPEILKRQEWFPYVGGIYLGHEIGEIMNQENRQAVTDEMRTLFSQGRIRFYYGNAGINEHAEDPALPSYGLIYQMMAYAGQGRSDYPELGKKHLSALFGSECTDCHVGLNPGDAREFASFEDRVHIYRHAFLFDALFQSMISPGARRVVHVNVPETDPNLTPEQITELIAETLVVLSRSGLADVVVLRVTMPESSGDPLWGTSLAPRPEHLLGIQRAQQILAAIKEGEELAGRLQAENYDMNTDGMVDYEDIFILSNRLHRAGSIQNWFSPAAFEILDRNQNGSVTHEDAFHTAAPSLVRLTDTGGSSQWTSLTDGSKWTSAGGEYRIYQGEVQNAGDHLLRVWAKNFNANGWTKGPGYTKYIFEITVDGAVWGNLEVPADDIMFRPGELLLNGLSQGLHEIKVVWTNPCCYIKSLKYDPNVHIAAATLEEMPATLTSGIRLVKQSSGWTESIDSAGRNNYVANLGGESLTFEMTSQGGDIGLTAEAINYNLPGWSKGINYPLYKLEVRLDGKKVGVWEIAAHDSIWQRGNFSLPGLSAGEHLVQLVWINGGTYDARKKTDPNLWLRDVKLKLIPPSDEERAIAAAGERLKAELGINSLNGYTFSVFDTTLTHPEKEDPDFIASHTVTVTDSNGVIVATYDVVERFRTFTNGKTVVAEEVTNTANPAAKFGYVWDPVKGYFLIYDLTSGALNCLQLTYCA